MRKRQNSLSFYPWQISSKKRLSKAASFLRLRRIYMKRNLPRRNSIPLCAYLFSYCCKRQRCSVFGIIASAILHGTEVGAASSFCFCCLLPLAVCFYGWICISFLLLHYAAGMMLFAVSAPSPPSCCFPSGIS